MNTCTGCTTARALCEPAVPATGHNPGRCDKQFTSRIRSLVIPRAGPRACINQLCPDSPDHWHTASIRGFCPDSMSKNKIQNACSCRARLVVRTSHSIHHYFEDQVLPCSLIDFAALSAFIDVRNPLSTIGIRADERGIDSWC